MIRHSISASSRLTTSAPSPPRGEDDAAEQLDLGFVDDSRAEVAVAAGRAFAAEDAALDPASAQALSAAGRVERLLDDLDDQLQLDRPDRRAVPVDLADQPGRRLVVDIAARLGLPLTTCVGDRLDEEIAPFGAGSAGQPVELEDRLGLGAGDAPSGQTERRIASTSSGEMPAPASRAEEKSEKEKLMRITHWLMFCAGIAGNG